MFLKDTCK